VLLLVANLYSPTAIPNITLMQYIHIIIPQK
jgi:hypothetical protein